MNSKIVILFCLVLSLFIYNLLVTIMFFWNMEMDQFQPYCHECTELCGVWKCVNVTLGESTIKKMEMEDIYSYIVATATVNLSFGLLVMVLLVWEVWRVEEDMVGKDRI